MAIYNEPPGSQPFNQDFTSIMDGAKPALFHENMSVDKSCSRIKSLDNLPTTQE